MTLQLEELCLHLLGEIVYRPLRISDSYGWQHDHLVKLSHIQMHRHLAKTDVEKHVPNEEGPYRTGISFQEMLEVEDAMVVKRHHHAGFV